MEDGAALVGLATALGCISLTVITGNPFFDALGSVLIGSLLGMGSTPNSTDPCRFYCSLFDQKECFTSEHPLNPTS